MLRFLRCAAQGGAGLPRFAMEATPERRTARRVAARLVARRNKPIPLRGFLGQRSGGPSKGPLSGRQTFKQGERCAVERREAFGAASAECAREPIGHCDGEGTITPPAARKARKRCWRWASMRERIDQGVSIAQTEIQTLTGDRMQRLRGITNDGYTPLHTRLNALQTQRINGAALDCNKASHPLAEARAEFRKQRIIAASHTALCVIGRAAPDQCIIRRAHAANRQKRKRPFARKTFPRPTGPRHFNAHQTEQRALLIVAPAIARAFYGSAR